MTPLSTPAARTVAGWKLVPIEPTEAMMDAAIATVEKPCFPQDLYAAMIAAVPSTEALPAGAITTLIDKTEKLIAAADDMSWSLNSSAADQAISEARDAIRAALTSALAQEDRT